MLGLGESGFARGMMLIRYHNLSVELEDKLKNYCITNKHIIELHKLFCDFDLAIVAEAEGQKQLRNVFIHIREKFEDIIQDSDSFTIYKVNKKSFVPDQFF